MTNNHSAFVGSVPENYDRYLGPILFEPYAADLVKRIPTKDHISVLELACGTGIVTRKLRDSLSANSTLMATDLNQAMIDCARKKFNDDEKIEWQTADATKLTFADQSFDLIVCQFGLMFFPDKLGALQEAYRVLKPNGTLLFNVWDAIAENEIADITYKTIKEFFPDNAPTFYEIPFSCYDRVAIETLLKSAGFKEINLTVVAETGHSPSVKEAVNGLVKGTPATGQIMERNPIILPEIIKALEMNLMAHYGAGPIESKNQALIWQALK